MEKKEDNKKGNKGKKISYLFLIVFIILLIFSSIKVFNYIRDSNKNKAITDKISKSIIVEDTSDNNKNEKNNKYKIDFKTLKEQNSDTIGFIKVNGTDVETVVVKGNDNNYYLSHNFEKQSNVAGWIFADYRNKLDGTDKNIIIYGHNMRNNTMFGTLKNILSKDWQENEENRFITFVTENEESTYEVFSVYQIEAEDYYIKVDFSKEGFKEYIDDMKSRSRFDFNVDVNEDDSILSLSTCANDNKYRVVLHAKKLNKIFWTCSQKIHKKLALYTWHC